MKGTLLLMSDKVAVTTKIPTGGAESLSKHILIISSTKMPQIPALKDDQLYRMILLLQEASWS